MMQTRGPVLTQHFHEALRYASALHDTQERKGSHIPYIAHLLAVTSIVLEAGGTEEEAIAAVLHDGPEDRGGRATLADIRRQFGENVGDIVEACSDTFETPKPNWLTRKRLYREHLAQANRSALLVSAADKLHNARSTLNDLRHEGPSVWSRFEPEREETLDNYRKLIEVYMSAASDPRRHSIVAELDRVVAKMSAIEFKARFAGRRESDGVDAD